MPPSSPWGTKSPRYCTTAWCTGGLCLSLGAVTTPILCADRCWVEHEHSEVSACRPGCSPGLAGSAARSPPVPHFPRQRSSYTKSWGAVWKLPEEPASGRPSSSRPHFPWAGRSLCQGMTAVGEGLLPRDCGQAHSAELVCLSPACSGADSSP